MIPREQIKQVGKLQLVAFKLLSFKIEEHTVCIIHAYAMDEVSGKSINTSQNLG